MPTLKDELAALKIERPPERQSRPWIKWVVGSLLTLLMVLAGVGFGIDTHRARWALGDLLAHKLGGDFFGNGGTEGFAGVLVA